MTYACSLVHLHYEYQSECVYFSIVLFVEEKQNSSNHNHLELMLVLRWPLEYVLLFVKQFTTPRLFIFFFFFCSPLLGIRTQATKSLSRDNIVIM